MPYDPLYIESSYRYEDEKGRYMTSPLQARSLSGGGYEYEWRGRRDIWKFPKHRLDELDARGEIHWPKKRNGVPRRKVYLNEGRGVPVQDVIVDILRKRESTNYLTKKPNDLLERFRLSLNHGGLPDRLVL